MISSVISRVSALLLAATGLAMLFASDTILPQLLPGLLPSASWLGQLIAAGWLSIALFNWNARNTILGGIYGRPAVNLNLMLYLVSALALFKADGRSPAVLMIGVLFGVMAVVYGAALLRGPFDLPGAR
jgi:hypothetical protein